MNKGRKISGGKYHKLRKKRLHERIGHERKPTLGDRKTKQLRVLAGKIKTVLLKSNEANIIVKGKSQKVEIKNVLETPSNKFLAKQNIITKGSIVETELGKVKITNRPSQEGTLNGILIE